LGNWEAASLALARIGYPFTAVALILDNRFENRLATRMRQAYGARIIPGARARARDAVRALQSGGPLVLHIDEYSAGRVQAPAFGRRSSQGNLAYAIRLSAMTGAAVIPFYCERLGDAARFKVRILPEVEQIVTGDAAADHAANVANLNDLIEPIVRAHLDQWFYGLEFEFDS
jgi:KDO2-lipid IV(A) lauroyltransferase